MVNVYEGDPPELVYRPMTDAELAQWNADQQAAAATPPPPVPLPEQIGAALAAIDPATATVADVLAALDPLFPKPEGG